MSALTGSWKTSLAGIGAALFTIGSQAGKAPTPKGLLVLLGLAMSLALLGVFAQDHK